MYRLSDYDQKNKPVGSRRLVFFLCFFLGFAIAFTTLFAIIHEAGHLLAGGEALTVELKDWSHVSYEGQADIGFYLAGWAFQFWVWAVLWGFNQWFSDLWGYRLFDVVSGFSWGYLHGTVIQALRSQDFIDINIKLGWELSEIYLGWLVITVPVLIVGWLIVGNCLKKMY